MYVFIVSSIWYVNMRIYELPLTQRTSNSTFHTGGLSYYSWTVEDKETNQREGGNGREKPDRISRNYIKARLEVSIIYNYSRSSDRLILSSSLPIQCCAP